jgi:hypothetical protein
LEESTADLRTPGISRNGHGLKMSRAFLCISVALMLTRVAIVSDGQSIGDSVGHRSYYISPSPGPGGDGSLDRPWDLATGISSSKVQPGDTVWLLGGKYGSQPALYSSKLQGGPDLPIVVRGYPGENAVINGSLAIFSSYTWFRDFEVTNTSGARTAGQPLLECIDTYPGSVGVKLINLVLHDCDQGIGFWEGAIDAEAYGNIIYYVGQAGPQRGMGHAIYTQNQTGTKHIADNIMFDAFDIGLQAYGSKAAHVRNYELEGNIAFNNGALFGAHVDNVFFSVASGLDNIKLLSNYTYHTPSTGSGYSRLGWESGPGGSLVMRDNYWIGGEQALQVGNFQNVTANGNIFFSQRGLMILLQKNESVSGYLWDDNTYCGSGLLRLNGSNVGLKEWASKTGFDVHSKFVPDRPTGTWTFVRPNKYETGRAHIVVYNWDLRPTVAVDIAKALAPGRKFELRDVQDYHGEPVMTGIYRGGSIQIPMANKTVAEPIGHVPAPPVHTGAEFGTFVLLPLE